MTKIKVTLGNLKTALDEIDKYEKSLKEKMKVLMERLAELGIEEATARFKNVEYDGVNDVVVDDKPTWLDDNKLVIKARGRSITFIEFGTGVYNPGVHPKANELGMIRGAYGKGLGKNEKWSYVGNESDIHAQGKAINVGDKTIIITKGNNPNRGMYETAKKLRQEIEKIAREVFKE